MAIYITTNDPSGLLAAFKKAIRDRALVTWTYDDDGDFTHDVDQWRRKAWLRPTIDNGRLILNIIHPQGQTLTRPVYGVYHGRFIEAMLTHCDTLFSYAQATAMPASGDRIS